MGKHASVIAYGLFGLLIAFWAVNEWLHATINHDLYWLQTGFFRLMAGQSMTEGFYEVNPPLSALIYAPVFLLAKTPLGLMQAMLIVGLFAVFLSAIATYKIIRRWDGFTNAEALLSALMLIVAGTLITRPEFGQRDHMIALGAVPLCALLVSRTQNKPIGGIFAVAVLILGTWALLLKPYYGLLPAVLMFHRIIVSRDIKAAFHSDFLIMAGVTLWYALIVWIAFPDYLTVIMPDLPQLYGATGARFDVDKTGLLACLWLYLFAVTFSSRLKDHTTGWIRLLLALAGASMLIYIIMNKGYAYHLIPFLTFSLIAAALLCQQGLATKNIDVEKATPWLVLTLTAIIYFIPPPYYPDAKTIREQEMTKIVSDCGDDCQFLMLGAPVRVIQHISAYTEKSHASRFSKDWFTEGLLQQERRSPDNPEIQKLKLKYAGLVAEDLTRFQPQLLIACHAMVNRVGYYRISPQFRAEMENYEYAKTENLYPEAFFIRTWQQSLKPVPCDIYKRK